jgi:hypothetical protein
LQPGAERKTVEYEIGKKYDVAIEDCCLHVYFVATLTAVEAMMIVRNDI